MGRLKKLFNVLHENYASNRVKPDRRAQLPVNNYNEGALTKFANDSVRAYNKFFLTQVFLVAAPESVRKLLSHKDQTRFTVKDAYQTFFTDHRVETDKKEHKMNVINVINKDKQDNTPQDQEVTVFRPQQQHPQQRFQQQNSGYKNNQQKGKSNNKGSFQKAKQTSQPSSGTLGNGKFSGYCKILNHMQE
jgi:hypothetical protein